MGDPDPHPDPYVFGASGSASGSVVWFQILSSSSKDNKKNLDFYSFGTSS
jgi:hypothetical protein